MICPSKLGVAMLLGSMLGGIGACLIFVSVSCCSQVRQLYFAAVHGESLAPWQG